MSRPDGRRNLNNNTDPVSPQKSSNTTTINSGSSASNMKLSDNYQIASKSLKLLPKVELVGNPRLEQVELSTGEYSDREGTQLLNLHDSIAITEPDAEEDTN